MRHISMLIIALVVGLGFMVISTNQASAGMALPCNLVIEKVEIPDNARLFDFDIVGSIQDQFSLSDGDLNNIGMDINDIAIVTEDIPDGYSLDIQCTAGSNNCGNGTFVPCLTIDLLPDGNGVVAVCIDNDTGSCTFTNTEGTPPPPVTAQVPTLSEWGLIAMAGVLGLIAFVVLRRKKALA